MGGTHRGSVAGGRTAARRAALVLATMLGPVGFMGCATTGSTVASGVGDRLLERPPYYTGAGAIQGGGIAHLPIRYQRGGSQSPIFDPETGRGTAVEALVEEMNAHLATLVDGPALRVALPSRAVAPDVRFGCERRGGDECLPREVAPHHGPWMHLAVGRPSRDWTLAVDDALASAGADRVLVITLEVDQYWPHQRNLLGAKEVRLGSDHVARVPWLTALDQPVQVLQLTGAMIGPDGRAIRIGAEGLVARRTNPLLSGLGVQGLIRDEDVQALLESRRDDLPGRPLVWQAALERLVGELTGDMRLASR